MRRPAAWLLAVVAVSGLAVVSAVVSQHVFGLQPCPWCILQRVIFIAIGGVALVAALLPVAALRLLGSVAVVALAGSGIAAALWQHFVAASSASCDLTLADRLIGALGLDARWPELFMPTASCAEARATMLGVPYEFYSLTLFVVVAVMAIGALLARRRRR